MKAFLRNIFVMTGEEYRANVNGLNIFFGAILGVIMADVESSSAFNYALVLMMVASMVIMLLYISASKYRLVYACLASTTLVLVWFSAYKGDELIDAQNDWVMEKLVPTLTAWLLMIIFVEFLPREKAESK